MIDSNKTTPQVPAETEATTLHETSHSSVSVRRTTMSGETAPHSVDQQLTDELQKTELLLQQHTERLRVLQHMNCAILAAQSPQAVAQIAITHLRQLIPCWRLSVSLSDRAANTFTLLAVYTEGTTSIPAGAVYSLEPGGSLRNHHPAVVRVDDIDSLPRESFLLRSLRSEGLRSFVNVPLMVDDQKIGSLNIGANTTHFFTAAHIDFACEVADSLAIALRQARLHEQLQLQTEELARTNLRLQQEIAERRQIELSLQDKAKLLHAILEGTSDIIFVKDLLGRYRSISTSGASWLGKTRDDIIGCDDHVLFTPVAAARIVAQDQHVITTGESVEYEETSTIHGRSRTFLARIDAYRDEQGRIIGVIGVYWDITERKRAEEQLRESESRYRSVIAAMSEGVVIHDQDGAIYAYNDSAAAILGLSRHDFTQRNSFDSRWHTIREDGSPFPAEAHPAMVTLRTGHPCANVVMGVYRPNGDLRWISINSQPFTKSESVSPSGVVVSFSDITEHRQTEAALRAAEGEYRAIFEHANIGIYRSSLDGKQLRANPALVKLNGYTSEKEMLPAVKDIASEWYVDPQRRAEFSRLLAAHEHVEDFESEVYRHKTRERIWISETARLIRNHAGEPVYYEGTVQDITARKQAEQRLQDSLHHLEATLCELKHTQQQIVRQERLAAIGQLAAGIAHDFNNILTGILGFAELLQLETSLSPLAQEGLQTISEQGKRAARLIRQVLDFSRQSIRQPHPLNLTSLLKETGKMLARLIPEHITVQIDYTLGEHWILADVAQLQQVLTNLAVNARDAMPAGGILEFRLYAQTLTSARTPVFPQEIPDGEWIVLDVCDTGTGMTPDVQEHLFEPFFSTKEVGKGTGLGLSQVYGIVKQHEGFITVQSHRDQGSTFSLYFPRLNVGEETVEAQETLRYGHGETILLVEDKLHVRKVLQAMLQRLGYHVLATANGREAMAMYQQQMHDIQLVITDMVMPEMGGEELYVKLVHLNPTVKIIVLSGYPLGEERRAFLTSGQVCWLPKPPQLQTLARTVHEALHERSEKRVVPSSAR